MNPKLEGRLGASRSDAAEAVHPDVRSVPDASVGDTANMMDSNITSNAGISMSDVADTMHPTISDNPDAPVSDVANMMGTEIKDHPDTSVGEASETVHADISGTHDTGVGDAAKLMHLDISANADASPGGAANDVDPETKNQPDTPAGDASETVHADTSSTYYTAVGDAAELIDLEVSDNSDASVGDTANMDTDTRGNPDTSIGKAAEAIRPEVSGNPHTSVVDKAEMVVSDISGNPDTCVGDAAKIMDPDINGPLNFSVGDEAESMHADISGNPVSSVGNAADTYPVSSNHGISAVDPLQPEPFDEEDSPGHIEDIADEPAHVSKRDDAANINSTPVFPPGSPEDIRERRYTPRTGLWCLHETVLRRWDDGTSTFECRVCGMIPRWLWVCTADTPDHSPFVPDPEPITRDVNILAPWIQQAITRGEYTEAQVEKLLDQKVRVLEQAALERRRLSQQEEQRAAVPEPVAMSQETGGQSPSAEPVTTSPAQSSRRAAACRLLICSKCRPRWIEQGWGSIGAIVNEPYTAPPGIPEYLDRPVSSAVALRMMHEHCRRWHWVPEFQHWWDMVRFAGGYDVLPLLLVADLLRTDQAQFIPLVNFVVQHVPARAMWGWIYRVSPEMAVGLWPWMRLDDGSSAVQSQVRTVEVLDGQPPAEEPADEA